MNKVVFDLTSRDYSFNSNIVNNGIVNKAIIYGKNDIGKGSLGIALFDIITHLTDKEKMPIQYLSNYLNLNNNVSYSSFKYIFQFDDDCVICEYDKQDQDNLLREKLTINNVTVINFDYFGDRNGFYSKLKKLKI